MNYPTFFMMVGLPGSGKTAKALQIGQEHNANVYVENELLSNFDLEKLTSDQVIEALQNDIRADLAEGLSVVYDTTNENYRQRMAFLRTLDGIPCMKVCVMMATPFVQCMLNSDQAGTVTPIEMNKALERFYVPQYFEGWHEILIEYPDGSPVCYDLDLLFNEPEIGLNHLSQDNPNHSLTVGHHCIECARQVELMDPDCAMELWEAALLHDIGKFETKKFYDCNGMPTEIAHYYQHENVSAYLSLFYATEYSDVIKRAGIIQNHMRPFAWDKKKTGEKYCRLWGDELFECVMRLHEADKAAR